MDHFDLNDFRKQIDAMKNMASMRSLMRRNPDTGQIRIENLGGTDFDEEIKRIQGIIDSMTPAERRDPGLIALSHRRRIASGSGADPADVSSLLTQWGAMAAVIRRMGH
jgi:signal recognition particle subunit SRP54